MIRITYSDFQRIIDAVEVMEMQLKASEISSYRKYSHIKHQLLDLNSQLSERHPYNDIVVVEASKLPEAE